MSNIENPLISVIVPIYRVEAYLERCVDSILSQTYRNLEIILVDDGSPDHCGEICDSYARHDDRIRVIHRANGGLSAARNSGLDICQGEYIGFVDSDDTIHPEMYERLYHDIREYNVKLAFCQTNVFCDGTSVPVKAMTSETKLIRSHRVIYESLAQTKWWDAYTKLYHRSLFDNIRYPDGRTNEDYPVTMPIYDKSEMIAVNLNPLYNYRIREGSIVRSSLNIRKFDQIQNSKEVLAYIENRYQDCVLPAEAILLTAAQGLLSRIYETGTHEFDQQEAELYHIIKEKFPSFLRNPYISKAQRFMLAAANWHPVAFKMTCHLNRLSASIKSICRSFLS
jgi:glycosyltransferase involved in cell wall biosynthesis